MSEAAEAAPAVVFKKRKTTGTSASRRTAGNNANEATSGPDGVDDKGEGTSTGAGVVRNNADDKEDDRDREESPANLAELIALRKLRQSTRKVGIDVEKVNAGSQDSASTKRKKRKAAADGQQQSYGLQKKNDAGRDGDSGDDDEASAITRKIMKTDNFTLQTGIVDVDKHMMAFIEKELKKRRGQESGEFDAEKEMQKLDPRDELFRVAEKYRIQKPNVDEGNVATSSAMLTAIPEVDLGIDNRLKNIEATEVAKRRLLEVREKVRSASASTGGQLADYHDSTYAGTRFFRHNKGNQTEFDALRAAKIEAGIEDDSEDEKYESEMSEYFKKEGRNVGRGQMATDDIVAERFKRKGLLQPKGKFR